MLTEEQKKHHKAILSLIEIDISKLDGDEELALDKIYDQLMALLQSLSITRGKGYLEQILNHPIDETSSGSLIHHSISQIKIEDPKSILFMKQVADLLLAHKADPNQKDNQDKSYRDLYIDKLFDFIVQNIAECDIRTKRNLKILQEYLPQFAENDLDLLRQTLRSYVDYQGVVKFPFPQYCIALALMSDDIRDEDIPEAVVEQRKIAELLIRYGADSKQRDYKGRTYDEYLDRRYTSFLFKQIYKYITDPSEENLKKLDRYLETLNELDPKILQKTLNHSISVHKIGISMPIQHFCLYIYSQNNRAFTKGREFAKTLFKYANPNQTDSIERTYEMYEKEIEENLSGRASAPIDIDEEEQLSPTPPLEELSPKAPDTPKLPRVGVKLTRSLSGSLSKSESSIPTATDAEISACAAAAADSIVLSSSPPKDRSTAPTPKGYRSAPVTPVRPSRTPSPGKITIGFNIKALPPLAKSAPAPSTSPTEQKIDAPSKESKEQEKS